LKFDVWKYAASGAFRSENDKDSSPDEEIGKHDTGLGCFVAGKKTTRANGATRFMLGSHLWDGDIPGNEDLAFYAEMEPGDAFFMLSSVQRSTAEVPIPPQMKRGSYTAVSRRKVSCAKKEMTFLSCCTRVLRNR